VRRIAHWLRDGLDLAPASHVAVLMGNRAEAVEAVIGAFAAGLWITPVNRHLRPEIAHVLADSGARVVIADASTRRRRARRAPRRWSSRATNSSALAAASDAPLDPAGPAGGTMMTQAAPAESPRVCAARDPRHSAPRSRRSAAPAR
jgi:acyl-CoA synthetase (AMP-forming)/AMP-acid ligase II